MPIISTCQQCKGSFPVKKGSKGIFCGSSCSATFNNKKRKKKPESNQKTSKRLKDLFKSSPKNRSTHQYECVICNTSFLSYKKKNTCSKLCAVKLMSIKRSKYHQSKPKIAKSKPIFDLECISCHGKFQSHNRRKTCSSRCLLEVTRNNRIRFLKDNAGTFNWIRKGKMNYVEQCFNDWLIEIGYIPNIDFVALSHTIYNDEMKTSYIMDFWFPSIKVNIELDGTHHLRSEQLVRDRIRDEYLSRIHSIRVMRIIVREWNNKNSRQEIKSKIINSLLCGLPGPIRTADPLLRTETL